MPGAGAMKDLLQAQEVGWGEGGRYRPLLAGHAPQGGGDALGIRCAIVCNRPL